jgi:hypothetical protein
VGRLRLGRGHQKMVYVAHDGGTFCIERITPKGKALCVQIHIGG